jgi:hypothetical protein
MYANFELLFNYVSRSGSEDANHEKNHELYEETSGAFRASYSISKIETAKLVPEG